MSAATETIAFLANYNSWRRGDETLEMPSPAEIGATIDDAVNLLRKYDELKARAERAEAELKAYRDAVDAQPWASDLPIRVLLDQITSELLATRNLLMSDADAQAELATERARLDWLMAGGVCMVQHSGGFYVSRLHAQVSRAAIDAAMKEETK